MALALWHSRHRVRMSRMFLTLVFVPLLWTRPAELVYRFQSWIVDWGWPGHMLAIALGLLGGVSGSGNVFSYILGGVVFNDTHST